MQQSSSLSIVSYGISEQFQHLPLEQTGSSNEIWHLGCVSDIHSALSQLICFYDMLSYSPVAGFFRCGAVRQSTGSLRAQTSHWNTIWNLDGVVKVLHKCIGYFCVDILICV